MSVSADQFEGFIYTDNGADISITGYTGPGGAVEIPAEIVGKPVTALVGATFGDNFNITNITIPGSVTSIGNRAFYSCTSLASAVFLGNAPTMGTEVFDLCPVSFTVYYISGALDFTTPNWMGYSSVVLYLVTYDAEGGAVNPANKTVLFGSPYGTLPTPTRSGYLFAGWWSGVNGTGARITAGTIVSTASNHAIYANWIATMIGVAFEMSIPPDFDGLAVAVKGLPSGLNYNPLSRVISGTMAKPGIYNFSIYAPNLPAQTTMINVISLPVWAYGSFNGYIVDGGTVSMTVTALGKITGKLSTGGKSYTFSAGSYDWRDNDGAFWFTVDAKAGTTIQTLTFRVSNPVPEDLSIVEAWFGNAAIGEPVAKLYRNVWKDAASTLEPYIDYYTATLPGGAEYGSGYLTFTVDKKGGVKTAGKLADGTAVSLSSTLILDETARVFAIIYTSPAAYKGGCLYGLVEFVKPGSGNISLSLLDSSHFAWENLNPQATPTYPDNGFNRKLEITGGWYNKTSKLDEYYKDITLTSEKNAGAPDPALTVGGSRYPSAWWNFSGLVLTPVFNKSGEMTGLVAPKPILPVKVNGEWDYEPENTVEPGKPVNTVGLTIGLTHATGVFKVSFKAWFDYGTTHTHSSRTITYQGVLTPEQEDAGRGFFLWPDKSSSLNQQGRTVTYPFNWSYDFLIQEVPKVN
jgi:hypothetical protein